jgi:predicted short-subunit dehydrogenase-like oxidoreductase (DUF2520 family)
LDTPKTITLIGAGNVATQLGKSLFEKGFSINQVYSKSIDNAFLLANHLNAMPCDDIKFLTDESDVYLICIKDDFIAEISQQLFFQNKLIAHTSGSVSIDVLNRFDKYGIFYPLQTFSKEKEVNISDVPLCIEANNSDTEKILLFLGKSLSNNVQLISSQQREQIHLAAVFACNFSNYMYSVSEALLSKKDIDFDILKPLILETAQKIADKSPKQMQTGPAIRNDEAIINKHIKMLESSEDYQELYRIITQNIIKNN